MNQATIVCNKISKYFGPECLFKNVSLTFYQGSSYVIQGVSGSGKSTFLSLVGFLDSPSSGTITYNQKKAPHTTFPPYAFGYLLQQPYLIKELTVAENIELPGKIQQLDRQYCTHRANLLLDAIDLTKKKSCYPGELSGGETQRVALARAVFNKPAFLIVDEPTSQLDQKTASAIVTLLCTLQKQWNMGLIVSTHDTSLIHQFDEQYIVLEKNIIKK